MQYYNSLLGTCTIVKSCINAAAYVQYFPLFGQASIQDRLIFKTGLCTAVGQLLAAYTAQSVNAESQHRVFYT